MLLKRNTDYTHGVVNLFSIETPHFAFRSLTYVSARSDKKYKHVSKICRNKEPLFIIRVHITISL